MSELLNSLNRLQRAGESGSRANQKLREAAKVVAEQIEESVESAGLVGRQLPRAYRVYRQKSRVGECLFLLKATGTDDFGNLKSFTIDATGQTFLHGDFSSECDPAPTGKEVLQFAEDIAGGLLGEIAAFIESERTAAEAGAAKLANAVA